MQCRAILTEHWNEVELLANALLEFETIESEQFEALMRGEDPFADNELPLTPEPATPTSAEPEQKRDEVPGDSKPGLSGSLPAPA